MKKIFTSLFATMCLMSSLAYADAIADFTGDTIAPNPPASDTPSVVVDPNSGTVSWLGRAIVSSPDPNTLQITNAAGTGNPNLILGKADAGGVMFMPFNSGVAIRNGGNTADANFAVAGLAASGNVSGVQGVFSGAVSTGNATVNPNVVFVAATASGAMLSPNAGNQLALRLGDNSGDANMLLKGVTASGNLSASRGSFSSTLSAGNTTVNPNVVFVAATSAGAMISPNAGNQLAVRLGDNSGDANVLVQGMTASGNVSGVQGAFSGAVSTTNLTVNPNIVFVAATTGGVMLAPNAGTQLALRLGNNSADSNLLLGTLTSSSRVITPAGTAALPPLLIGTGAGLWSSTSNVLNMSLNGADFQTFAVLSTNVQMQNKIGSGSTNGFAWYNGAGNALWTIDGTNGGILKSRDGLTLQVEGGTNGAKTLFTTVNGTASSMSGATVTISNIIPAGSIVIGVALRVTTLITSGVGTSFTIGDGTTANAFGSLIAFTAGTTTNITNWTLTTPPIYTAATSIVLTCTGGTFTAGAVRVAVTYIQPAAPTS